MKKIILTTLIAALAVSVFAQYPYSGNTVIARGNDNSTSPSISSNGGLVAFYTKATNLASSASSNGSIQVYNTSSGTWELCSPGINAGVSRPYISRDGLFVVFYGCASTMANTLPYYYNLTTHALSSITTGSSMAGADDTMEPPTVSDAVGSTRYIAFRELQSTFVPPHTFLPPQILVWDKAANTTKVASRTSGGNANLSCTFPAIDSTGSNLAFVTSATNLVSGLSNQQVYYSSLSGGTWSVTSSPSNGMGTLADWPSICADGSKVVFHSNTSPGTVVDLYYWGTSFAAYQPYPSNTYPPAWPGTGPTKHTWQGCISPDGAYISMASDRMLDTYTGNNPVDLYPMIGYIGLGPGVQYSYVIHVGANDGYLTGFTGTLLSYRVSTSKNGREGFYGSVSNNGDYAVFFTNADRIVDTTYPSFNEIYLSH